jgi:hypothetical protein
VTDCVLAFLHPAVPGPCGHSITVRARNPAGVFCTVIMIPARMVGNAGSRPISEAKQPWACLVLRWGITAEGKKNNLPPQIPASDRGTRWIIVTPSRSGSIVTKLRLSARTCALNAATLRVSALWSATAGRSTREYHSVLSTTMTPESAKRARLPIRSS